MVKLARRIEGIPLHHKLLDTDPCLFGPSVPLNPKPLTGEHLPRVLNDHPEPRVHHLRPMAALVPLESRPAWSRGHGQVALPL